MQNDYFYVYKSPSLGYIFDLNGRLVDKMRSNNNENVNWTPKYKTASWYVALVKNGNDQYVSKFFVKNN